MVLTTMFLPSLYEPNNLLNAAKSPLVCINPPSLSGLNLPPPVTFSAIFFNCVPLSDNILLGANINSGAFVILLLLTFSKIEFTSSLASSMLYLLLSFSLALFTRMLATSSLASLVGLKALVKNPLLELSNIL